MDQKGPTVASTRDISVIAHPETVKQLFEMPIVVAVVVVVVVVTMKKERD
jgi:hypothetical protein